MGLGVAAGLQSDRAARSPCTFYDYAGTDWSSLEKMAQEIRHLQRTESARHLSHLALVSRVPRLCRISAIPNYVNVFVAWRGSMRGYSVTAMENVALWHERDISHSSAERIIIPDGCMLLHYMLHIFTNVMEGLQVEPNGCWPI